MKGVIHNIHPDAQIIDISHNVPPQDISQAALMLSASFSYFPKHTLFVVVVDPGVGSGRRIIAATIGNYYFLVPDNGILTPLLNTNEYHSGVKLENSDYFLHSISQTFHGRDIFAPVAAHIAKGVNLEDLGPPIAKDELVTLDTSTVVQKEDLLCGQIQYIDHFGNLVSDISKETLNQFLNPLPQNQKTQITFIIGNNQVHKVYDLSETYASVAPGELLAIIGSRNFIEISVNCGNANKITKSKVGDPVIIKRKREKN